MVVCREHDVGVGLLKNSPVPVGTRREQRVMPVGERADRRRGRQLRPEPCGLRGAGVNGNIAVQGDGVLGAQREAVVAQARRAGVRSEVLEVRLGAGREVLVITWHRPRAALEASPRRLVAVAKVLARPRRIGMIPEREDRPTGSVS